jgi:hypothetical protein
LLSVHIPRGEVRVELLRQGPERSLDLGVARAGSKAEDLVQLLHYETAPPRMANLRNGDGIGSRTAKKTGNRPNS